MTSFNLASDFFNKKKAELYEFIKHCKNTIPYYKENLKIELPKNFNDFNYDFFYNYIPLLNKESLKNDSENFISDIFLKTGLTKETTSGSEGKPLVCYKTKTERLLYSKTLWEQRFQRIKNLKVYDKCVRFYAFSREKGQIISDRIFKKDYTLYLSLFNLSEHQLEIYWKEIVQYKPKWMHGPPSAIVSLALIIKSKNLNTYHFEFIEITGEYVSEEDLSFIKNCFACEVFNLYGTRELWPIAYSCHKNSLHILDKNVFVESIYNSEYEYNEIIITTLKNRSWGLIRYRLGDLGNINTCTCENTNEFCLSINKSRKTDYYKLSNGKIISPILFSFLAITINELENNKAVTQYQVIKDGNAHFKICLASKADTKCKDRICNYYASELDKILEDNFNYEIFFVDYIPPDDNTGKYKNFIDLTS